MISPYTGRVLELKVYRGSAVSDGTPMVSIQPDAGNLEALVYLSAVEAKDVKPGMAAQISPGTVRREDYGFMTGNVAFVADYPATPVAMMSVLGNDPLVQSITAAGPVTEVRIDLDPAPHRQRLQVVFPRRTSPTDIERHAVFGASSHVP